MHKSTCCVHSGTIADKAFGGLNSPVYTSSSFEYIDRETVYPRYFNTPNQQAVVEKLCALENAADGLLFSSGMAAISTVILSLAGSGDHVVLQRDIYGGTHHFVMADFQRYGIAFTFTDSSPDAFEKALRENTRIVYIETPSNPLLGITDIAAVARLAKSRGIVSVIDNTFASPVNQTPLDLGVDLVVHSGTKYLGGHSDICCGAVLGAKALVGTIRASAANLGGSLNAQTCCLLERSLKTLSLRVERQNHNAMAMAAFLQGHRLVTRVYYPGLEDHPGHQTAARQMKGFGGMLSFELDEAHVDPARFLGRLELIRPAISLGGVETIICAPAQTSHAKLSARERAEAGITDGLFRLSVGIEDVDDLIADLAQAMPRGSASALKKNPKTGVEETVMDRAADVFYWLPCTVVFVSTAHGAQRDIMTATAMFVSEKEPLVLISVARGRLTEKLIGQSGRFTLVIAAKNQRKLAVQVGSTKGGETDKFQRFAIDTTEPSPGEAPIPRGAAAWMICQVENSRDIEGYRLFIGRVVDCQDLGREPLIWQRDGFFTPAPV